jgi:hypothetical protein
VGSTGRSERFEGEEEEVSEGTCLFSFILFDFFYKKKKMTCGAILLAMSCDIARHNVA